MSGEQRTDGFDYGPYGALMDGSFGGPLGAGHSHGTDPQDDAGGRDNFAHLAAAGDAGWREVMGIGAPPTAPGSLGDLATKVIFGDLWQRPGLTVRDRRLVTLTVIAMLGRDRVTPFHIHAALDSGDLTEAQLQEMAVQMAYYAGWPVGTDFSTVVEQVTAARSGSRQPGAGGQGEPAQRPAGPESAEQEAPE